MAKLYFRYGAMNSGKSTALMQVAHNYEEQGMKVLILKPQVDTKGGGELVSRLGVRRKADLLIPPQLDVFEAVKAANAASGPLACVLCDESQFFTPEQAEQLFMITVDLNIPVICYGLQVLGSGRRRYRWRQQELHQDHRRPYRQVHPGLLPV